MSQGVDVATMQDAAVTVVIKDKVATEAVATAVTTATTMVIKEADTGSTTIAVRSISTIKGTITKVVVVTKAMAKLEDLVKVKAEEEFNSVSEGGTTRTTLKLVLGPAVAPTK